MQATSHYHQARHDSELDTGRRQHTLLVHQPARPDTLPASMVVDCQGVQLLATISALVEASFFLRTIRKSVPSGSTELDSYQSRIFNKAHDPVGKALMAAQGDSSRMQGFSGPFALTNGRNHQC